MQEGVPLTWAVQDSFQFKHGSTAVVSSLTSPRDQSRVPHSRRDVSCAAIGSPIAGVAKGAAAVAAAGHALWNRTLKRGRKRLGATEVSELIVVEVGSELEQGSAPVRWGHHSRRHRHEPAPVGQIDDDDDDDLAEVISKPDLAHAAVEASAKLHDHAHIEGHLSSASSPSDEGRYILEHWDHKPPAYWKFAANTPGDAGFDPLGLCQTERQFIQYRQAELKHCRLAMLAAAGWPLSELWHPLLAEKFGFVNGLRDGLAPTLVNGGIGGDSPPWVGVFLVLTLEVAAVVDCLLPDEAAPGDYGWDPLGVKLWSPPDFFRGKLPKTRSWMLEAEIKNGRLAMLAVTAYALEEFITKVPVVKETPYLFVPML